MMRRSRAGAGERLPLWKRVVILSVGVLAGYGTWEALNTLLN